jgi:hypothetical protein
MCDRLRRNPTATAITKQLNDLITAYNAAHPAPGSPDHQLTLDSIRSKIFVIVDKEKIPARVRLEAVLRRCFRVSSYVPLPEAFLDNNARDKLTAGHLRHLARKEVIELKGVAEGTAAVILGGPQLLTAPDVRQAFDKCLQTLLKIKSYQELLQPFDNVASLVADLTKVMKQLVKHAGRLATLDLELRAVHNQHKSTGELLNMLTFNQGTVAPPPETDDEAPHVKVFRTLINMFGLGENRDWLKAAAQYAKPIISQPPPRIVIQKRGPPPPSKPPLLFQSHLDNWKQLWLSIKQWKDLKDDKARKPDLEAVEKASLQSLASTSPSHLPTQVKVSATNQRAQPPPTLLGRFSDNNALPVTRLVADALRNVSAAAPTQRA